MPFIQKLILGFRALFQKKEVEKEMDEELRAYIDAAAQERMRAGMSPEQALRAARVEMGSTDAVKEGIRSAGWESVFETFWNDLRYGIRQLRRNPGFTAVAIITLALGIGANTAIFSLIDAVMLRALPVDDPSQLVLLRWSAHAKPHANGWSSFGDCDDGDHRNPAGCSFPYPFFQSVHSEKDAFSGVTAFAGGAHLVMTGNGLARIAGGELVSGDYFSTLGVKAALGRTLTPNDDTPAAPPVVVLSYAYWQVAFAGSPSAIGRSILLNSVPFTVVGVAEPGFTRLTPGKTLDLFIPLSMLPRLNVDWGDEHDIWTYNQWWLVVVARLKPGLSLDQAQAATTLTFRNAMLHGAKALSKESDDPKITLVPAQQGLTGQRGFFAKPLYLLMSAVGLVLLIACANVAGLLLARAAARQKEMAVRLAMGAGRARIIRQLLTESVTLSLAGGGLGVLFAYWGVRAMTGPLVLGNTNDPFPFTVEPDWRALLFTISISLLTGLIFGLAPALRSTRLSLTSALKENSTTLPGGGVRLGGRWRLDRALVVVQVGLSTVVLVGAGLMVRTLQNLRNVTPGFDTRNLLLFAIDPTLEKYRVAKIQSLYQNMQEQIAALPGVLSVSYSSDALLSGSLWTSDLYIEGQPDKSTQELDMLATGPDFLQTMHIPLLAGRTFTSADFDLAAQAAARRESAQNAAPHSAAPLVKSAEPPAPPVPVLVNATFVHQFFENQNPLGRMLSEGGSESAAGGSFGSNPKIRRWEIVGVVGDTKYDNLRRQVHPGVYIPLAGGGAYFEVRTASNPSTLIPSVRQIASRLDNNLPLFRVSTQTETIEGLVKQERIVAHLSTFFGLLALLLSCVGLYGLLAYEVARRTREIGIRMSLGAERGDVTRLIILRGIRLTAVGLVVGAAGGLALTRIMSSLLFNVKPTDPPTYLAVGLLLAGVALLASYIPAWRASRVDPMVALRYE